MRFMVIYRRVGILLKRLTSSRRVHILHRRQDEIFLFRLMDEHSALIIRLLDVPIIMGQIRILHHLSHFLYRRYKTMNRYRSMAMDRIFVTGSMLRTTAMRSGRFLLEQNQRAFIMLVVITNIPIWKSQKYSYNLLENPKILCHLFQIAQVMINGMQLMQRKSEMSSVGVQNSDLKMASKKQANFFFLMCCLL